MRGEGVYDGCKRPAALQTCRDWKELAAGILRDFGGWCIAECAGEEGELCFFVGKIISLDQDYLTLQPVGADGSWTKDTAVIPYEDLCTITFGDNYLKVYAKYMKKQ